WKYRIRYLFLLSFFITFLLAGIEATFQLFQMSKIDITPKQVGYLFMASGFVDAFIQGGVVRRVKNGTETKWIFGAQIITAIGLLLIPFTNSLFFAGFALSVFTAGNALGRTVLVSLTSKESGGRYGTAAGMSYSMDNMGRIFGPLLFVFLFTKLEGQIYYISATIAILSLLLLILFNRSSHSLKEIAK
ncbi:MAG TPA: MFS transporter, partial [Savagea sp.]